MHRIDTVNARPNQNGAGKAGFNDNTDLAGQDATYLDPAHLNAIQEEIATVIEATGTPLEKGTNHQLWTALNSFFASNTALEEVDSRLSTAITTLAAAMQQAIITERNAERNRVWPVGKGRYTTYDGLNPADASHLGWGTWELDAEMAGRVAVGAGVTIDDRGEERTFGVGDSGGEFSHVQVEAEVYKHNHAPNELYTRLTAYAGPALLSQFAPFSSATSANALNDYAGNNELQIAGFDNQDDTINKIKDVGEGEPMNITQPYYVVSVWLRTG
ncbi:MAG: hypothetical protein RLY58_525 [Pseudomonadota bacterium]|jgi:hypothetical protein